MAKAIRALLDFMRYPPSKLKIFALSIYQGMSGNPRFPEPLVSMEILKSQIDALSTWIVAAMDGSRTAIAKRNVAGHELKMTLRLLAGYVEYVAGRDMPAFLSSRFKPDPNTRTNPAPLSESIRKIMFGDRSGELKLRAVDVSGASSYQVRWAVRQMDRSPRDDEWTTKSFSDTRSFLVITGLKTGTFYVFQVRALIGDQFTDWSHAITHMAK